VSTLPACATELSLVQACIGSTEIDGPNSNSQVSELRQPEALCLILPQ
jgi:hypothetical protein